MIGDSARRTDAGSASLYGLMGVSVLFVAFLLVGAVVGVASAVERARTGADLAALAAARQPAGDACAAARLVARRNGGALTGCRTGDSDVTVEVTVPVPRSAVALLPPPVRHASVHATARAGPVSPRSP